MLQQELEPRLQEQHNNSREKASQRQHWHQKHQHQKPIRPHSGVKRRERWQGSHLCGIVAGRSVEAALPLVEVITRHGAAGDHLRLQWCNARCQDA